MRRLAIISLLWLAIISQGVANDVVLADLALNSPDGSAPSTASALTWTGATWTADGLFLPAAVITRIPRAYPVDGLVFPPPQAPYRADLLLPDLNGRCVTITLIACLATSEGDQDNLFSIGRRSRWLSAQVGVDGRIVVGLDNRWQMLTTTGTTALPAVTDRRWHVCSVALGEDRSVLLAVDGVVAELHPARDQARFPPRLVADDQAVLSLADPGSARHLHGLLRRLIVHRGQLDRAALIALHRRLIPAPLPPPQAAIFLNALKAGPAASEDPIEPTAGATNF